VDGQFHHLIQDSRGGRTNTVQLPVKDLRHFTTEIRKATFRADKKCDFLRFFFTKPEWWGSGVPESTFVPFPAFQPFSFKAVRT
jgi:hypothetical protein